MSPHLPIAPEKLNFIESFALSGLASIISETAAAPVERMKLLLQSQGELLKRGRLSHPYRGVVDCTVRTVRNEGFLSLWRGNVASCLRCAPTQGLTFAFKQKLANSWSWWSRTDGGEMVRLARNVSLGGTAGACSLFFMYSLDFARTRLGNDIHCHHHCETTGPSKVDSRQYKGLIDVYRKTLQTDGVVGLYRGFCVSCVGIMVYRGWYFGLYDTLSPILLSEEHSTSLLRTFPLAYGVTVVAGMLAYPLDTLRRRMMMTTGESVKYRSSWDCALQMWRLEGPSSFMRGAGANVVRGVTGGGIMALFEKFKSLYLKYGRE